VLRGGTMDAMKAINSPGGTNEPVDTQEKLLGLSVQVWPRSSAKFTDTDMRTAMTKPVPNTSYTLTRSDAILKKGGTITFNSLEGNPYHALVSGITVEDLVGCFSTGGMHYDK
jgi:hypothetical protein